VEYGKMKKIRLMLVDDHDVVRAGLKAFLESQGDFEIVAEAGNGEEAIRQAELVKPDVIIMDITMPGMDGMEATTKIRINCPDSLILALTVHDDKQYLIKMLTAGASGYITKQSAVDELVAAIHTIASGNIYLQPALARWLLEDYQRLSKTLGASGVVDTNNSNESEVGWETLSLRERQVLELVAAGINNNEIRAKLKLSPNTIARHRERIMNKLNMHSRTELVKFAIRSGLVKLG